MQKIKSTLTKPTCTLMIVNGSRGIKTKYLQKGYSDQFTGREHTFRGTQWPGNCKVSYHTSFGSLFGIIPKEIINEFCKFYIKANLATVIKFTAKDQPSLKWLLPMLCHYNLLVGFMPIKIGYNDTFQVHIDLTSPDNQYRARALSLDDVKAISTMQGYAEGITLTKFEQFEVIWAKKEVKPTNILMKKTCIDNLGCITLTKGVIYTGLAVANHYFNTVGNDGKKRDYMLSRFK
jgi:hypothetical protein